jgi:hypothetical protein
MRRYQKSNVTMSQDAMRREPIELDLEEEALLPELEKRPKFRGDCVDGERPCHFLSCRYHLFLDVSDIGSIIFNFPGKELDELEETCALDVADKGGLILEKVGELMSLTRERIRQVEANALRHALPHARNPNETT